MSIRNIWHNKKLEVGSILIYQGKRYKVLGQKVESRSANFGLSRYTLLMEVE